MINYRYITSNLIASSSLYSESQSGPNTKQSNKMILINISKGKSLFEIFKSLPEEEKLTKLVLSIGGAQSPQTAYMLGTIGPLNTKYTQYKNHCNLALTLLL